MQYALQLLQSGFSPAVDLGEVSHLVTVPIDSHSGIFHDQVQFLHFLDITRDKAIPFHIFFASGKQRDANELAKPGCLCVYTWASGTCRDPMLAQMVRGGFT